MIPLWGRREQVPWRRVCIPAPFNLHTKTIIHKKKRSWKKKLNPTQSMQKQHTHNGQCQWDWLGWCGVRRRGQPQETLIEGCFWHDRLSALVKRGTGGQQQIDDVWCFPGTMNPQCIDTSDSARVIMSRIGVEPFPTKNNNTTKLPLVWNPRQYCGEQDITRGKQREFIMRDNQRFLVLFSL